MKETTLRHWHMLRMIPRSPRAISTREIRDRLKLEDFDVHIRTIQRDLDKLTPLFGLVNDNKQAGWSYMEGARVMDIPGMDASTALTFKLVNNFLTGMLPVSVLYYLKPHIKRAEEILEQERPELLNWTEKIKIIPSIPLVTPEIKPEVLAVVYEAILKHKCFTVEYLKAGAKNTKGYTVNPLGLIYKENIIYMVCILNSETKVKHLLLHRIREATLIGTDAKSPETFNLNTHLESGEHNVLLSQKPITLKLLLEPGSILYLLESPLNKDQKVIKQDDGRLIIEAEVLDTQQLHWWLLSLGDNAQILEPAHLRKKFAEIYRELSEKYSKEK